MTEKSTQCSNSNLTMLKLEESDHAHFLKLLENHLNENFKNRLHENYGREKPWSLLNLVEHRLLDSYVLLYHDGKFWGGFGGIVRQHCGKIVYQTGFRAFTNTRFVNCGLGSKSLMHEYVIKYHITRAKKTGCQEIVLSFNAHNERLFKITRDYHLKKVFGPGAWKSSSGLIEFNGVPQWLLTMCLL